MQLYIQVHYVAWVPLDANTYIVFGCKHGKVDQESAPLNVNLEMPLESDPY